MLESALSILKTIENAGFEAYIVGGYVRNYILGIPSNDIDITTNALPTDINKLFSNSILPQEPYGSTVVNVDDICFEVTTFRQELAYNNNRKPIHINYVPDLKTDLQRRDFTINTLCMNQYGDIIDLLDGKKDILNRSIQTVGNSNNKFQEDPLRILRAIRFATELDFTISSDTKIAIMNNKSLLANISYQRKKQELDKIFTSSNRLKGIDLLIKWNLLEILEIKGLSTVKVYDDLLGTWSIIDNGKYPFTKRERKIINNIKTVLKLDNLNPLVLYKYGLYVNSIAAKQKGLNLHDVEAVYQSLPIHSKKDIAINSSDILNVVGYNKRNLLTKIYEDIANKILLKELSNTKVSIISYCKEKYGNK